MSGGERKRTNIGAELMTQPTVICLDEPTSGLDSVTAYSLFNTLSDLTIKGGRTILASLHQPSSDLYVYPTLLQVM